MLLAAWHPSEGAGVFQCSRTYVLRQHNNLQIVMSSWPGDIGTKYLTSRDVKAFFTAENGEWIIPTPSSADAKKQSCSSRLFWRKINHVDAERDADWGALVHWLQDQLFSPDKPRFAVIKIGLSILDSSIEHSGDLSELNKLCAQKDTEELFIKGDDVKCALLHSLLRAGVTSNPSYFVSGNRYDVRGRHMKEHTVELVKELGLHWDPLEISVLGMTYHRDESFVGGHARVSDLAAYLKQYGCWRREKDLSYVPFCTLPYPVGWGMDKDAAAVLSTPQFQKCIEVPSDHITIVFCNNHIDLFNPDRCGVLHDAYMPSPANQAPAKRRVALCSIQDVSHEEAYNQLKQAHKDIEGWSPYIKFPYITPQFRSVAVSYLQKETRAKYPGWCADGFWDGGKHEWLKLPGQDAEEATAAEKK